MNMKNRIPKIDDLTKMSQILYNEFGSDIDLSIMEIHFKVGNDMVKMVNEDLYYRYNSEGSPEPTDEVMVKTNGVIFKYVGETE